MIKSSKVKFYGTAKFPPLASTNALAYKEGDPAMVLIHHPNGKLSDKAKKNCTWVPAMRCKPIAEAPTKSVKPEENVKSVETVESLTDSRKHTPKIPTVTEEDQQLVKQALKEGLIASREGHYFYGHQYLCPEGQLENYLINAPWLIAHIQAAFDAAEKSKEKQENPSKPVAPTVKKPLNDSSYLDKLIAVHGIGPKIAEEIMQSYPSEVQLRHALIGGYHKLSKNLTKQLKTIFLTSNTTTHD